MDLPYLHIHQYFLSQFAHSSMLSRRSPQAPILSPSPSLSDSPSSPDMSSSSIPSISMAHGDQIGSERNSAGPSQQGLSTTYPHTILAHHQPGPLLKHFIFNLRYPKHNLILLLRQLHHQLHHQLPTYYHHNPYLHLNQIRLQPNLSTTIP